VMFMLCIAQLGPAPVLVPAIIWLYWRGEAGWGTFLLVWSLVVSGLDSVLRPMLIRKGANLPLILLLAGVIGGLIAFGLVGIFLGPVGTATLGVGRWGQLDLGGEVIEWSTDTAAVSSSPCLDCAYLGATGYRVGRGSAYTAPPTSTFPPNAGDDTALGRYANIGVLCARAP
ncbi:MAG: AI-2E family transporter, partial [Polyangiaceae bacterium]